MQGMHGELALDPLLDRDRGLRGHLRGDGGDLLREDHAQPERGGRQVSELPERGKVYPGARVAQLAPGADAAAERQAGAEEVPDLGVDEPAAPIRGVVAEVVAELVRRRLLDLDLDRRGVPGFGRHHGPREHAELQEPALDLGELARIQRIAGRDVDPGRGRRPPGGCGPGP
jgi:hypothetical protein